MVMVVNYGAGDYVLDIDIITTFLKTVEVVQVPSVVAMSLGIYGF